jgi:hypothetical protein
MRSGAGPSAASAGFCGTPFSQDSNAARGGRASHAAYGGDALAADDDIVLLTFNRNECA